MIGDRNRRRHIAEQRLEAFLAFEIAERGERLAVLFKQVEGEEMQVSRLVLRAVAAFQDCLERGEVGVAVLAIGDDLAVDQTRRQVERGDMARERGELVGPVEPAARVDDDLIPRRGDERAITVELDLVEPVVAGRHGVDERRQLEFAEFGRLGAGF